MYAVIKTGGKQYRVQPGDILVVEKLEGEPGAAVAFGDVLMLGDGEAVTVGAPLVDGASVASLAGRIVFAGAERSSWPNFMAGAVESGEAGAERVAALLGPAPA